MEHKHYGKSSAKFLDAEDILNEMHFNGDETFMDAGCGDGYISIKAAKKYLPQGIVYAVDSYDVAINELEEYKDENDVQNLINVHADITEGIPSISDDSVDAVLMLNVFHGFRLSEDKDNVIIWSEGAIPYYIQNSYELLSGINEVFKSKGSTLLTGIQSRDQNNINNSIITLGKLKDVNELIHIQHYDKRELVPFGEVIPFKELLRPLGSFSI